MFKALAQALRLIGNKRRRRFALVGALAVIVSGLEAAGALMVLALMRLIFVENPGQIPDMPVIGDPTRILPLSGYRELVVTFAGVFAIFFVLRAAAFLMQQYALARVAENTGVLLAHDLMSGYLSMPYEFHLTRNSAELIRNAYDNVQELVGNVFKPMATVFAESIMVLVMLVVLLFASPVATLGAAVLMALTVAGTFAFVQPRLEHLGQERQAGARSAIQHLQQGLGGLRDIKILHREQPFAQSFREARIKMARAQYWRAVLAYVPRVSIELAFLLFVVTVLLAAVLQDSVEAVLETLALFAYAGLRVQPSLQKVANGLNNLRYADAVVQDLTDDLTTVRDAVQSHGLHEPVTPLPFERAIRFHQVSFRYAGGESALEDIDLTIIKGESIGIAGATGGGKTTLLDLLCGLLLPTEGRITIDETDLAPNARAWQTRIGVVHQSSFLIDATIRENIAFGVSPEDIDDHRVRVAISLAELDELVGELSNGLSTVVGERGVRLSGGQRQRITLARALYREPDVLVLDEGTSALDNATEARVISNVAKLPGVTTTIMVAHRLTSIMDCDRIIFLDSGRISGIGSYEELKVENPLFRAMAK